MNIICPKCKAELSTNLNEKEVLGRNVSCPCCNHKWIYSINKLNVEVAEIPFSLENFAKYCLNISPEKFIWKSLEKKQKTDKTRWQQFNTPDEICNQMVNMYKEKFNPNDKILILFNLEFIKALALNYENLIYQNIYFITDCEEDFYWIKKHFNLINIAKLEKFDIDTLNQQIGKFNMKKFDIVFSNPPYDGNLHLKIINEALKLSDEIIAIHPARWFQDPLAEYKRSDKIAKKLKNNLKECLFFSAEKSCSTFKIGVNSDLMISKFNKNNNKIKSIYKLPIINSIFEKILNYSIEHNIKPYFESSKIDGWRCEVKEMAPIPANGGDSYSKRMVPVDIVKNNGSVIFHDGYTENGIWWSLDRGKNKYSKKNGAPLPLSIKFKNKKEAENFRDSYRTKFIKNWIYLIKYDMHMPLFAIPYMNDYSHEWTNEDYCKFFNLTPEESEFMCRDIFDYRIKDFIEYDKILK